MSSTYQAVLVTSSCQGTTMSCDLNYVVGQGRRLLTSIELSENTSYLLV